MSFLKYKMDESLIEKIDRISESPGVYLMKDDSGNVIYAGKAGNLKKRLSYYFKETRPKDLKTSLMVKKIADFEIIITGTEKEALILE